MRGELGLNADSENLHLNIMPSGIVPILGAGRGGGAAGGGGGGGGGVARPRERVAASRSWRFVNPLWQPSNSGPPFDAGGAGRRRMNCC